MLPGWSQRANAAGFEGARLQSRRDAILVEQGFSPA
jgi:hypothetical protein